jgi:hypothetical protein
MGEPIKSHLLFAVLLSHPSVVKVLGTPTDTKPPVAHFLPLATLTRSECLHPNRVVPARPPNFACLRVPSPERGVLWCEGSITASFSGGKGQFRENLTQWWKLYQPRCDEALL